MTSRNPSPQLVDGVDVDAVAAAVRRCPGVEDLAVGALGSAASYLPGRTVPGIAVTADRVTIQVRARWAVTTAELATQVRAAVRGLIGPRRLDIVIADIGDPGGSERSAPALPALPPGARDRDQPTQAGQRSQPRGAQHATPGTLALDDSASDPSSS